LLRSGSGISGVGADFHPQLNHCEFGFGPGHFAIPPRATMVDHY
jgi:hypothetical protein